MSIVLVVLFCLVISNLSGGEPVKNDSQQSFYSSPFELKKHLEDHCRLEYTATCFKVDVAALVPPISTPRSFHLLPGLVLEMGGFNPVLPRAVSMDIGTIDNSLDRYLVKGMDGFINSLALRVKVMDKSVSDVVRSMGITLAKHGMIDDKNQTLPREFTGRRRKLNQAMMMGGMVSAGTLLALTMSAISALAGKAMMVSLLSLGLSLLNGRGGGGGGGGSHGGKISYEIIHHTSPPHDAYAGNTWDQSDPLGEATHHFVKPLISHLGIRRAGIEKVDTHPVYSVSV